MTPALNITLGLFFIAGGGFVVLQGLRARKASAAPLPRFFKIAFAIHAAIALIGLFLVARGLLALGAG
ncbi:MAG: hypothetical protein AB7E79_00905 [Rhodospirillaceae bacterium]